MKRLLYLILLITTPAYGIVSISPEEPGRKRETKGEIGGSYASTSGNTDTSKMKVAAKVKFFEKGSVKFIQVSYNHGTSNSKTNIDNTYLHLRYIKRMRNPKICAELFSQAQKNPFKAIESRYLLGGGLRWKITQKERLSSYLGLGLYNAWLDENGESDDFTRGNAYVTFDWKIRSNVTAAYTGYCQPDISDFSDYHVMQNAQISFKMTDSLAFVVKLSHTFDSDPATGVSRYDFSQVSGVNYSF